MRGVFLLLWFVPHPYAVKRPLGFQLVSRFRASNAGGGTIGSSSDVFSLKHDDAVGFPAILWVALLPRRNN